MSNVQGCGRCWEIGAWAAKCIVSARNCQQKDDKRHTYRALYMWRNKHLGWQRRKDVLVEPLASLCFRQDNNSLMNGVWQRRIGL